MDEEQVKKLIDSALTAGLKQGFQEFREFFKGELQTSIKPIQETLAGYEVATEPQHQPSGDLPPEYSALIERLAKMEQLEQQRQQELRDLKFNQFLNKSLAQHNPLHSELVAELLTNRYKAQAIEKDGQWLLPNGSTLAEEVSSFFKSDTGLHFLPNPSQQGGELPESGKPQTSGKAEPSLEEMLADMSFS